MRVLHGQYFDILTDIYKWRLNSLLNPCSSIVFDIFIFPHRTACPVGSQSDEAWVGHLWVARSSWSSWPYRTCWRQWLPWASWKQRTARSQRAPRSSGEERAQRYEETVFNFRSWFCNVCDQNATGTHFWAIKQQLRALNFCVPLDLGDQGDRGDRGPTAEGSKGIPGPPGLPGKSKANIWSNIHNLIHHSALNDLGKSVNIMPLTCFSICSSTWSQVSLVIQHMAVMVVTASEDQQVFLECQVCRDHPVPPAWTDTASHLSACFKQLQVCRPSKIPIWRDQTVYGLTAISEPHIRAQRLWTGKLERLMEWLPLRGDFCVDGICRCDCTYQTQVWSWIRFPVSFRLTLLYRSNISIKNQNKPKLPHK